MKTNVSKTWLFILFIALYSTLVSFSAPKGGEGFEVYLNNKLIIQKFGKNLNDAATFNLGSASANDELMIKYHHCSGVGKERHITIKNEQGKVLKVWDVVDVQDNQASIRFKVKEILNLPTLGNTTLQLYYSSSELPSGRLLASLHTNR